MITEEEVEKAAAYIRDNSKKYAKAKAERIYLQEFRKSKKALLVSTQTGTVQEKESYAYSHHEYLELLEGYRAAIEEEEEIMWMIRAAQAKIEIWRTQQANNRNIDNSHR
jgi:hypothetical protein